MRLMKSAGEVISDAPVRNLEGLGRLQYIYRAHRAVIFAIARLSCYNCTKQSDRENG